MLAEAELLHRNHVRHQRETLVTNGPLGHVHRTSVDPSIPDKVAALRKLVGPLPFPDSCTAANVFALFDHLVGAR